MLRVTVSLLAAAVIFYGAMVVLAACKVGAHTINSISGYETIYDHLTRITAGAITGRDRIIVAVAGILCPIVFAPLAWRTLPRPYFARGAVDLDDGDGRGQTELAPRAIERAAEIAAQQDPRVDTAAGRYATDRLRVQVSLRGSGDLPVTLRAVQRRVTDTLATQGLPTQPVGVILTAIST